MTIRNETGLQELFADNSQREINAQMIRDFVKSVIGIGGTMYANDQTISITTNWEPVTVWTDSIDTKGLSEDLVTGTFTIATGADGVYAVDVSTGIFSAFAGWVEIALTKNGALTPYRKKRTLTAGGDGEFGIPGTGNLAAGDNIGLAIRGSGNADIILTSGQYRAVRI